LKGSALAMVRENSVFHLLPVRRVKPLIPKNGIFDPLLGGVAEQFLDVRADVNLAFPVLERHQKPAECLSGLVLQGQIKPPECPAFGRTLHA
jgi:hypothetical protein